MKAGPAWPEGSRDVLYSPAPLILLLPEHGRPAKGKALSFRWSLLLQWLLGDRAGELV